MRFRAVEWVAAPIIALILVAVMQSPPVAQGAPGDLSGSLPSGAGIGLVVWGGGPVEALATAAAGRGCTVASVWVVPAGVSELVGYVRGAPGIVNAAFTSLFPGGLGANVPVVVVCRGAAAVSGQYGDRYANGILPVGDGRVSTSPRKGYIYSCNANFVPAAQAGAQAAGPWFLGNGTWDSTRKVTVQGSQAWAHASVTVRVEGGRRVITSNGLPGHGTGTFPVQPSDPAYQYDRNPNRVAEQSFRYDLPASPPGMGGNCVGGEAGVMLNGVPLFNDFDAGGRDAQAWEVQDRCDGHPQRTGVYHYHGMSKCFLDVSATTVIGFALDGYPITGPKVGEGNVLTTADLDDCHGMTGQVMLDGTAVTTYRYVLTQDFPYSVGCFRGTAIRPPGGG